MYFPVANPVSLVEEDFGVWAPPEHQRVISKLTMHLGILFHLDKRIPLEPLPETMLDEGKASPVPDVLLRDNDTAETPVIIEVCHSSGQKGDLQKVIQLIDSELYGIREGFVYNYKTGHWLRYQAGDGGQATESSFSDVLGMTLAGFV